MKSPTGKSPTRSNVPPGFRPTPKPKHDIEHMTDVRELNDLYNFNQRILSSPDASTSSYFPRISAEQLAIKSRLVDLQGVEAINASLMRTSIRNDELDVTSRAIEAKRKAISRFANNHESSSSSHSRKGIATMDFDEAAELQRQAHAAEAQRQQEAQARRERMGAPPRRDEILTKKEREARIWAFMNHKPTDSDLEDDSDYDSEDEDPATWFDDDEDNGVKGQTIVEPDEEDWTDIIRVDTQRMNYNIIEH
ncbi:uncharacterized protein SCHCODRAFT_02622664 [Schizophyllum commune H4-8]|nr:uncharacterized protein SCHCODRAFT_02622664 [Schizophyllum commune H4-8]KAI5893749.1 hypothetical protein SCHCODRAFT_02622664 [Schizophyllum commune H4-8]